MAEPVRGNSHEHRTVSRITGILEFVAAAEGPIRLTDIVAKLDAPRSSVHGLVHGLVAEGYLGTRENGRFELGPAVETLLRRMPPWDGAIRAAMEALHIEFGETVTLVLNTGTSIVTSDAIESRQAIRYTPVLGIRRPLYPTSAGRCFLAYEAEGYRERYIDQYFDSEPERQRVREDLQEVAAAGYAVNVGQTFDDLCAVSTPIMTGAHVKAVMTVAGPISRVSGQAEVIAQAMAREATRVSDSTSAS